MSEPQGEACDRCGEVDFDRRTLSMSCFYAMDELRVPFKEYAIHGQFLKKTGTESFGALGITRPVSTFEEPNDHADRRRFMFFSLRVCKDCRAGWMGAIETWFNGKPKKQESCGSGIFVRENGATVEITEEEWKKRNGDREPVRWRPNE